VIEAGLGKRTEQWKMEFNPEKCEERYFQVGVGGWWGETGGGTNKVSEYTLNSMMLGSTEDQRDVGIHVHRSLKSAGQGDKIVKNACGLLAEA